MNKKDPLLMFNLQEKGFPDMGLRDVASCVFAVRLSGLGLFYSLSHSERPISRSDVIWDAGGDRKCFQRKEKNTPSASQSKAGTSSSSRV